MNDPGKVILRRALRAALVLPPTYIFVVYGLKLTQGASFAMFGAFALLAFSDFGGPTRDRAFAYLLTGSAGMVAITIGSLAAGGKVAAIVTTFVFCFWVVFSSVLRGYVGSATTSILLPYIISVTLPYEPGSIWQRLVAYAIGVVVATVAALVLWPVHNRSALRLRSAEMMRAAANVARVLWPEPVKAVAHVSHASDLNTRLREMNEAHNRLREAFGGRLLRPGSATQRDRALVQLIDELGRLRIALRWRPPSDESLMPADHVLAAVTAETLDRSADAIGRGSEPPSAVTLDIAREQHREFVENWATARLEEGKAELVEDVLDGGFHLRLVAIMAEMSCRLTRLAVGCTSEQEAAIHTAGVALPDRRVSPASILRQQLHWRSPWFRNSLRAAIAMSLAVTVVVSFSFVQHGFWIVLGVLAALRMDALGTGKTALQAIIGTVGGFIIGSCVLLLVGHEPVALWLLLPIMIFLAAYTPGAVSLTVGQASFTVFVLVFYAIAAGPTLETGGVRVLDVAIGLTISLVVSALMWPRGVVVHVRVTLVAAIHSSSASMVAAYDRLVKGPVADAAATEATERAADALDQANETYDLAISQGGAAVQNSLLWANISNTAHQILASAELVMFLARIERGPVGCPAASDALLLCAHHVQNRMDVAVDQLNALAGPGSPELVDHASGAYRGQELSQVGDPFTDLREQVLACLKGWNGVSPSPDLSLGQAALSLVWAQDWLIHLGWIAHRLCLATQAPTQTPINTDAAATA